MNKFKRMFLLATVTYILGVIILMVSSLVLMFLNILPFVIIPELPFILIISALLFIGVDGRTDLETSTE